MKRKYWLNLEKLDTGKIARLKFCLEADQVAYSACDPIISQTNYLWDKQILESSYSYFMTAICTRNIENSGPTIYFEVKLL